MTRMLPFSEAAEFGLAAILLANPSKISDVFEAVRADHFFTPALAKFFQQSVDRYAAGDVPLDLVRFAMLCGDEFDSIQRGLLKHKNVSPLAAEEFAEIIKDAWTRRRQIVACESAISDAVSGARSAADIGKQLIGQVEGCLPDTESGYTLDAPSVIDRWSEQFDRSSDQRVCVTTGIRRLDQHHGGDLCAGEVVVVAAQTGLGKTQFALQVARHAAVRHGKRTLAVTLEMGPVELVNRWVAIEAAVAHGHNESVTQFKTGQLITPARIAKGRSAFANDPEGLKQVVAAKDRIQSWGLNVYSPPSVSASTLRAVARNWKAQNENAGLIVVDYLQLMEPEDGKSTRNDQVAQLSRAMKVMAREIGVPVMALSQLNRQADKDIAKPPELHHLRDSGGIGQDANKVWFIHRPNNPRDGSVRGAEECQIVVRKNRGGPEGIVKAMFRPGIGFSSPVYEESYTTCSSAEVQGQFAGDIAEYTRY